ncbi:transporter substrate-binding domain-containing protein [Devosia sp. MC1541]|uniref:substrate-binding periplasmic protein n=1 Tax=Devosia sp. MC1541 TaxID=2725264 RepID=UPI00145EFC06|nr:transporter substrate-binding domain-containing protein [Devosia sp. MC1541]
MRRKGRNRWLSTAINIGIIVVGLTAVSFLPADTSLKERRDAGFIKLCVPPAFPPLVTGNPEAPGYDIELMQMIADRMGLRLVVNTLASIGADFNPRNWLLTRAQCDVIAGGVADSEHTRGYLQTIPTDAVTGWVLVARDGTTPVAGDSVAVLPGTSGLNRLAVSGWLRESGFKAKPARNSEQFKAELLSGAVSFGVTERFIAASANLEDADFSLFWLPEQSVQLTVTAIGMWKGDQTLKSEIIHSLSEVKASKAYELLRERYQIDGEIGRLGS